MESKFYDKYFEIESDNWWFRVRRNIVFDILAKYGGHKVLDYGCGSGFLTGKMQEAGFDAYGVDISDKVIETGIRRGIKNLHPISSLVLNFNDCSFDSVLALDVIEHIENDQHALRELIRLVRPNGHLVIMVPAYQWMWGLQDVVAHHYRRYNMKTILELTDKFSEIKPVRQTYFNTFLFPPAAAIRLASRVFKLKGRDSDFDINNSILNKIFYSIFNFESKLLNRINFPFGVSILLVLKKNE